MLQKVVELRDIVGVMEYEKQLKISFLLNFLYPSDIKVLKHEQNAKVPYKCYSSLGILKIACFILERMGFVLIFRCWEFLCSGGINGFKSTKFHTNCQTKWFFFYNIKIIF
jgi:hypothetical protein